MSDWMGGKAKPALDHHNSNYVNYIEYLSPTLGYKYEITLFVL